MSLTFSESAFALMGEPTVFDMIQYMKDCPGSGETVGVFLGQLQELFFDFGEVQLADALSGLLEASEPLRGQNGFLRREILTIAGSLVRHANLEARGSEFSHRSSFHWLLAVSKDKRLVSFHCRVEKSYFRCSSNSLTFLNSTGRRP